MAVKNARAKGNGTEIRVHKNGKVFSRYVAIPFTEDNYGLIEAEKKIIQSEIYLAVDRGIPRPTGNQRRQYNPLEKDVLIKIMQGAFVSAKKRGDYHLSESEENELMAQSKDKCALTGVRFSAESYGAHKRPFAPSLDRIDSSKGYENGNCRFVCVAANVALNEWGDDIFDRLACAYVAKKLTDQNSIREKSEN